MMAVMWQRDKHRSFYGHQLTNYYRHLEQNGVMGYRLEHLTEDYRRAILLHLCTPAYSSPT